MGEWLAASSDQCWSLARQTVFERYFTAPTSSTVALENIPSMPISSKHALGHQECRVARCRHRHRSQANRRRQSVDIQLLPRVRHIFRHCRHANRTAQELQTARVLRRLRCRFSRVVDQDQGILLGPLDTLSASWPHHDQMPASGRALLYTHLLLPTDGSALSERAIDHGVALAKAVHAGVTGVRYPSRSRPFQ